MNNWRKRNLKSLTSKIGRGATPTGGDAAYKSTGTSLIRSQNILDFRFSFDGLAYIDDDQAAKLKNVSVEAGDVLINITGDSVARCCMVELESLPARVNQHVAIVRADKDEAVPSFLKYALLFRKEELLTISEIGATRRALTKGLLETFEIHAPDTDEQQAIAEVLSSLDDKIDLLHRQNKTLESLAETLFRHWFIDGAKDDWERRGLLDVVELVGGGTPKTSNFDYWDGDIPWLSGGDIATAHKSFAENSIKTITVDGLRNSSAKLLPQFATVISARGTVGKYCMLAKPMTYSQSNYGILPRDNRSYCFSYLLINHVVDELQSAAYGSVFDTITTMTFADIKLKLPNAATISDFETKISPYFQKKLECVNQIAVLERFRDTLLPKLMSGEIRVEYQEAS